MRKKLAILALTLVMMMSLATPAFAASSGNIPIGFQLYGFEAADFAENGEGEYVGMLELTAYRIGYQWNVKQVSVSNDTGAVQYLEYTEFAEAPSWTPYYISTQKVAIKQTAEEQTIAFTYSGPASSKVVKTVTVTVPAFAMPVLNGISAVSSDLPELISTDIALDENGNFNAAVATNAQVVRLRPSFIIADVPTGAVLTAKLYADDSEILVTDLTPLNDGSYQAAQPHLLLSPGANRDNIRYDLCYEDTVFGSFILNFEPEQTVELDALIESITIDGLLPVAGGSPENLAPYYDDPRFVIEDIQWTPVPATDGFSEGTTYTAVITVQANEGYLFNGNFDALNIMSGWSLNNVQVDGIGNVTIGQLDDFSNMPYFERFSFQVAFPPTATTPLV